LGIVTLNRLKILDFYADCLKLDKKNITDVKLFCDNFTKRKKSLSFIYLPVKIIKIVLIFILSENLELKAQIKTAITGLAIERYRLKYHRLPKSLNQLVPEFIKEVPNDPFTAKPLRYVIGEIEIAIPQKDKNSYLGSYIKKATIAKHKKVTTFIKRPGWMVYSFGADLDDDNGLEQPDYHLDNDIPFRSVKSESPNDPSETKGLRLTK
jgi:hypothetical protein